MRTMKMVVVMGLAVAACSTSESDVVISGIYSMAAVVDSKSKPTGREWVQYGQGGWNDVEFQGDNDPKRFIVQLGLKANDKGCIERHRISELPLGRTPIPELQLGGLSGQYTMGRRSGVIVRYNEKSYIITTVHGGVPWDHALSGHTVAAVMRWSECDDGGSVEVPSTNLIPCQRWMRLGGKTECEGAFLACEIDGAHGGLPLAGPVEANDFVRAVFHPLGLPMKSSPLVRVEDCNQDSVCCRAFFDNANGGSGGAILTPEQELAGIVIGAIERGPCNCAKGGECYDCVDVGKWDKCESGQPFLTSGAIKKGLDARDLQ